MRLNIHHVGVFRSPQRFVQCADHAFLMLTVSGVVRVRAPGGACTQADAPYLSILLAGETGEFEFGPDRENWVIQFDTPDLWPHAQDPGLVQLRAGQSWVNVRRLLRIAPAHVAGWREEFRLIRETGTSPLPLDRFRAELAVLGIFRAFVDSEARVGAKTPAQEFRRLIDQDAAGVYTLAALAQRVGYSGDHLRTLFLAEFGIAPQAYRAQRRMASVMELIANSRLAVKEIAARTGFRDVSHLSSSFKKAAGITPREGIKRYRYGRQGQGSESRQAPRL